MSKSLSISPGGRAAAIVVPARRGGEGRRLTNDPARMMVRVPLTQGKPYSAFLTRGALAIGGSARKYSAIAWRSLAGNCAVFLTTCAMLDPTLS